MYLCLDYFALLLVSCFLVEPLKINKQTKTITGSVILVMVVSFPNSFDNVIEERKFDDMLSVI